MGEVLSTFSKAENKQATGGADGRIGPVKLYCKRCGWAQPLSKYTEKPISEQVCWRCGSRGDFEELAMPRPPADGVDTRAPPDTRPDSSSAVSKPPPTNATSSGQAEEKKSDDPATKAGATELFAGAPRPPGTGKKKLLNVNRRSRAYSRQFVMNVAAQGGDPALAGQDGGVGAVAGGLAAGGVGMAGQPLAEEDPTVRPVVRKVVELTPQYQTEDGVLVVDAIEKILSIEKLKSTKCLEIADEVYMELIINEVNGYNFVAALLNVFTDVSLEDFGLFLATPPDEGTMSLLEEAVCQESLDLFYEVLRMGSDAVLKGVLRCKELPEEVRQEVLDLMSDANSDPDGQQQSGQQQAGGTSGGAPSAIQSMGSAAASAVPVPANASSEVTETGAP